MLKNATRRTVRFLVAIAVAALPLLVQPAAVPAASAGTLFAVFGETQIVRLDPATGGMTTLVELRDPTLLFGSTISDMVSDAADHRIDAQQVRFNFDPDRDPAFFETYQMVTVDTQTGGFTISSDMPDRLNLAFDPATGGLFGVTLECCTYQLFRIDPSAGTETPLATVSGESPISTMAVVPGAHALYIVQSTPGVFPPTGTLLRIDTVSGSVSVGPALSRWVSNVAYDSSLGTLYGKTSLCCGGAQLVRINTTTGEETTVGTFDLGFGGNSLTIDPSTHKIYVMEDILTAFDFFQQVGTVDPQAGTIALSPEIPLTGYIRSLAFEAVVVTADAVIAEVNAAIASGAISNPGIGASLIAELRAGAAAQARGDCAAALRIYGAFVNDVNAQSGKTIDPATAAKLAADASSVTCP